MISERLTSYTHAGLTFDVTDDGPLDGEPVVLLHGFPQRATSWAAVTPLLHAQGYRTYAPDLRGYSPGARPRRRRDYTTDLLAGDVVALLDVIGGRAHLVGHDWGAAVAWAVAALHGDRLRTLTSVSVPHPGAFVRSLRSRDQLRRSWYMAAFQLPVVPERILSSSRGRASLRREGMTRAMVDRYDTEIVTAGALPGGLGYYRAMPFGGPGLLRAKVTVPTTHVWSDGDQALGRRGADLCREYVDADYRLEVVPGVSHWIPDQAPEVLARIILERVRS